MKLIPKFCSPAKRSVIEKNVRQGSGRCGAILLILAMQWVHLSAQGRNDLTDLSFCLDPGHGMASDGTLINKGVYGYSETEKVLSIAVHLKELLEVSGADTVILTRSTNSINPSLTSRTAIANNNNVDWFHSIHSNAFSDPSINHVIVLLEERREFSDNRSSSSGSRGVGLGVPYWQGQADVMSQFMVDNVSRAYRIDNRGTRLDWTFYGGANGGFTLGVLRTSFMPAELSEGGFHSNPTQNLRNMNEEYKRVEAKALWISILDYYDVQRPPIRTVIGIIRDKSTGNPLNGVSVETNEQAYTTNSFHDTFYRWQVPDTITGNGVYYFEDVSAGVNTLAFHKEGYSDLTTTVTVSETFLTFSDVVLEQLIAAVDDSEHDVVRRFSLEQNYPNPFNPSTVISFHLPVGGRARVEILDMVGQRIATLVDDELPAGQHRVTWNGTAGDGGIVASGVYFCALEQGSSVSIRKMTFLR